MFKNIVIALKWFLRSIFISFSFLFFLLRFFFQFFIYLIPTPKRLHNVRLHDIFLLAKTVRKHATMTPPATRVFFFTSTDCAANSTAHGGSGRHENFFFISTDCAANSTAHGGSGRHASEDAVSSHLFDSFFAFFLRRCTSQPPPTTTLFCYATHTSP